MKFSFNLLDYLLKRRHSFLNKKIELKVAEIEHNNDMITLAKEEIRKRESDIVGLKIEIDKIKHRINDIDKLL